MSISNRIVVFALTVVLFGSGLWLSWNAVWGPEGIREKQKLDREIEALQYELKKLKEENEDLQSTIRLLNTDHEARQDEVRKELGMLRSDEAIILPEQGESFGQ